MLLLVTYKKQVFVEVLEISLRIKDSNNQSIFNFRILTYYYAYRKCQCNFFKSSKQGLFTYYTMCDVMAKIAANYFINRA